MRLWFKFTSKPVRRMSQSVKNKICQTWGQALPCFLCLWGTALLFFMNYLELSSYLMAKHPARRFCDEAKLAFLESVFFFKLKADRPSCVWSGCGDWQGQKASIAFWATVTLRHERPQNLLSESAWQQQLPCCISLAMLSEKIFIKKLKKKKL